MEFRRRQPGRSRGDNGTSGRAHYKDGAKGAEITGWRPRSGGRLGLGRVPGDGWAVENLYMLQSFIEAADGDVNRSQFRTLAYPMLARNREVYSFEWLPVVHEAERAKYEPEAKAEHLIADGC